jgi:hypothetical protein
MAQIAHMAHAAGGWDPNAFRWDGMALSVHPTGESPVCSLLPAPWRLLLVPQLQLATRLPCGLCWTLGVVIAGCCISRPPACFLPCAAGHLGDAGLSMEDPSQQQGRKRSKATAPSPEKGKAKPTKRGRRSMVCQVRTSPARGCSAKLLTGRSWVPKTLSNPELACPLGVVVHRFRGATLISAPSNPSTRSAACAQTMRWPCLSPSTTRCGM